MILFVFEGKRREPDIFKTLEYLYFPQGQSIVCSFGNNIYELYRELKELDDSGDIVSILREKNKGNPDTPFTTEVATSDFSEIFLFFDYDFQNRNLTLEQMNRQLSEMLTIFNNETDNGKLFINYQMIEAIRYTKALPDIHFHEYTISRVDCQNKSFKDLSQQFSDYGSLDFIILDFRRNPSNDRVSTVRKNWTLLEEQSIIKANSLCNGVLNIPTEKDCISQERIFEAQLSKHIIHRGEVAILSAFPLFKFSYFKR